MMMSLAYIRLWSQMSHMAPPIWVGWEMSSLVEQSLPSCKSTLWNERFREEIVGLRHVSKPAFSRLCDTINLVLPFQTLLFLLHEMLFPLINLGLNDTSFLWAGLTEYPMQNRLLSPIFLISALYLFSITHHEW